MKIRRTSIAAGLLTGLGSLLSMNAHAQSVEMYGLIGTYVGSFKRSGDPASVRQLGGGG
jgi:hypothetical protein